MKSSLIRDVSITIVLALTGYFGFSVISSSIDSHIAFAIGVLIGGLVISALHTTNINSINVADEDDGNQDTTTLYIGNLAYRVNESAVRQHFSEMGEVKSVRLMQDKRTGKKKGFGFVEVNSDDADKMIDAFNDTSFHDRTLKVRLAKDRKHKD